MVNHSVRLKWKLLTVNYNVIDTLAQVSLFKTTVTKTIEGWFLMWSEITTGGLDLG
jgi:hypothetical protein